MAKIIKIKSGLGEKQKDIEKEITKQYRWIKVGKAIVGLLVFIAILFWGSAVFASTQDNKPQGYDENKAKIEQARKDIEQKQEEFQKEYESTKAKIEQSQADSKQKQEEFHKNYNEMKNKVDEGQSKADQPQRDENVNNTESNAQKIQTEQAEFQKKQQHSQKMGQGVQGFLKTIFLAMIFSFGANINKKYRMSKINKLKNQLNIYNSGLTGEINTIQRLSKLSDEYTIINNPIITTNGSSNELDNIIIGSNGIFIVETKNYTGLVHGDINDKNWTQEKVVKNKPITKEFYSPVMQVKQHGRRMNELLNNLGYNLNPKTIVYFVNPDVTLSINGTCDTKVFCEKELNELINMIESFEIDVVLSENDKEKIIDAVVSSQ